MKHVCAESYAKEKQFDDEIDDRDKLEEVTAKVLNCQETTKRWFQTFFLVNRGCDTSIES